MTARPGIPPLYIAAWRRARGMTQARLSRRTGIAPAQLSRLETGARRPNVRHRAALAAALELDAKDLFFHPSGDPYRDLLKQIDRLPLGNIPAALKAIRQLCKRRGPDRP